MCITSPGDSPGGSSEVIRKICKLSKKIITKKIAINLAHSASILLRETPDLILRRSKLRVFRSLIKEAVTTEDKLF